MQEFRTNEIVNGPSVMASHLLEYLYCPRYTYFEHVLDIPEHQEKRFKVQKGRDVHSRVRKTNPNYLRKKLGVVDKKSDVYLSSPVGIRGIVDEVLFLKDGTAAPLDYKFAEYKDKLFKTYRMQIVFYARLIQDHFKVPVKRGYIIYTRSRNKLVEVSLEAKDFKELDKTIQGLWDVIVHCKYPKPTRYKRRCPDCCYKNICERSV
jgi:CRISPR-associated exonuclease Cas4